MDAISQPIFSSAMPEESQKESFHKGYVYAVAARAGIKAFDTGMDYGIDMYMKKLYKRGRRIVERGLQLDCQLKASTTWKIQGQYISYDLEAKNYNDLVENPLGILILFCLPPTLDEWIIQDETQLILHNCCYYWYPEDRTLTKNTATKVVKIARTQQFTPMALENLMNSLQKKVGI